MSNLDLCATSFLLLYLNYSLFDNNYLQGCKPSSHGRYLDFRGGAIDRPEALITRWKVSWNFVGLP